MRSFDTRRNFLVHVSIRRTWNYLMDEHGWVLNVSMRCNFPGINFWGSMWCMLDRRDDQKLSMVRRRDYDNSFYLFIFVFLSLLFQI